MKFSSFLVFTITTEKSFRGCSPRVDCSGSKAAAHCRVCSDKDLCNFEPEKFFEWKWNGIPGKK